ncbi:hypothetical protein [Sphingomonas aerolata]|uniref:GTP pyrophosphokinase n=1 Tax=Sphingomonas aerolata TaxID=185951 RepID=UPI002FE044B0
MDSPPKLPHSTSPSLVQANYTRLAGLGGRLISCLSEQISALVASNEITLAVPIESRIKSFDSIQEKSRRKGLPHVDLDQIGDMVGLRLIVVFSQDVIKLDSLIRHNLIVFNHEDAAARLDDNQFGYQSNHYNIKLLDSWLTLPNYSDLGGLQAEIQVRTIAQHMWAVVSHKLQYKHEDSVPAPIRRSINRASALLETVDLEFARVLKDRSEYNPKAMIDMDPDVELDIDILSQILDEMLPPQNKDHEEHYDEILREMRHFGIKTASAVRNIITDNLNLAIAEDRQHIGLDEDEDRDQERYNRGVYYTFAGLMRTMLGNAIPNNEYNEFLLENSREAIKAKLSWQQAHADADASSETPPL